MRRGFLTSFVVLLASTGFALAEEPPIASAPESHTEPGCCGSEMPGGSSGCDNTFWLNAEYLLWWFKDSPVPTPLLTATAPRVGTGIPGDPNTKVVLGGRDIDLEAHSGARLSGGIWLDCDHTCGVEGNYFFLASRTVNHSATGNDHSALAVPHTNAATGLPFAQLVTFPGIATGGAVESLTSRLQGAELNGIINGSCGCNLHLAVLGGFRWIDLRENLVFATATNGIQGTTASGVAIDFLDNFNARNDFYGGQVGARAEYCCCDWAFGLAGKIAIGDVEENVTVRGSATVTTPTSGTHTFNNFGNFVQPSNAGHHERDRFAYVPEVTATVGYNLSCCCQLYVGYDFLYLSKVARPGNQIDGSVSPGTASTGAAHPAFPFNGTEFWAQGLIFGARVKF
jgi:hypothetical protein